MALSACKHRPVRAYVGCACTCLLLLLSVPAFSQKAEIEAGIAAFNSGKFPDAAQHFQRAVASNPQSVSARLYLGSANYAQFIPGLETPENQRFASSAAESFNKILTMEPNNEQAIGSLVSLYYNQKRWDDALDMNRKLLDVDPDTKEAWYTIGVIAFIRFMPADRQARVQSKMRPEDPGPIRDSVLRREVKMKYMPMLDEGISALKRALEIEPEYDDAMAYMNLLLRYRADLLNTSSEYVEQVQLADQWVQKALFIKQKKAARN